MRSFVGGRLLKFLRLAGLLTMLLLGACAVHAQEVARPVYDATDWATATGALRPLWDAWKADEAAKGRVWDDEGHITNVENSAINRIAKIAGCPAAKKSGIYIHQKIGATVKKGEVIFTIYSDSKKRLDEAVKYYNKNPPQKVGGMTLDRI